MISGPIPFVVLSNGIIKGQRPGGRKLTKFLKVTITEVELPGPSVPEVFDNEA